MNFETIKDAIADSIASNRIARVTAACIGDVLAEIGTDWEVDYAEENDGTYDVWSTDGEDWRLCVTIESEPEHIVIGRTIGQAIARDVLADDMPRGWDGIDAQDGDLLTAAGIEPNTAKWEAAEEAARAAYLDAIQD